MEMRSRISLTPNARPKLFAKISLSVHMSSESLMADVHRSVSSKSNHLHIYVVLRHSAVVCGRLYRFLFAHSESYVVFNMLLNAQ